MEDDLWWKKTTDGRRPLRIDDLRGKTTFMEDKLRWKKTFDGRQPVMEDDLGWLALLLWAFVLSCSFKIMPSVCLYVRRPLMEDDLWWRTTLDGRHPSMEDDLWWKLTIRWPLWMTTFDGGSLQNDGCAPSFWGRLHFWGCPNVWRRTHLWKMTFMEDDLWWKTTFDGSPYFCECMSFQVTSK